MQNSTNFSIIRLENKFGRILLLSVGNRVWGVSECQKLTLKITISYVLAKISFIHLSICKNMYITPLK